MIDPKLLGSKKIAVLFKKQGQKQPCFVKGRNAQTLLWLIHKGAAGVTAAEVMNWALRLGAYVYNLRHTYGLDIQTVREPHEGGIHARYVLGATVTIDDIIIPGEQS